MGFEVIEEGRVLSQHLSAAAAVKAANGLGACNERTMDGLKPLGVMSLTQMVEQGGTTVVVVRNGHEKDVQIVHGRIRRQRELDALKASGKK